MEKSSKKYNPPKTFIKRIAIELKDDFELNNNSFTDGSDESQYIGRKDQRAKFVGFLESAKKGVYLVTGYRGIGKTSFVNLVINELQKKEKEKEKEKDKKEKKEYNPIFLTLAQTPPNEIDVLKQMVHALHNEEKEKNCLKIINFFKLVFELAPLTTFLIMIFVNKSKLISNNKILLEGFFLPLFLSLTLWLVIYFFSKSPSVFHFIDSLTRLNLTPSIDFKRLDRLYDRINSSVTEEQSKDANINTGVLPIVFKALNRKSLVYPVADAKIIEYELIQILKKLKNRNYIFVFDELDKIEFQNDHWNLNEDMESYENRSSHKPHSNLTRGRKQSVLHIVSGLKNLFTSADADFIFIAGREMFDASLADIANKQKPLSSIFTYTFHIETLLKEQKIDKNKKSNISSLNLAIEEFLKLQFFKKDEYKYNELSLFEMIEEHYAFSSKDNIEKLQVYNLLESLKTYLIYRSSGSPKNLIKVFQEFVLCDESELESELDFTIKITKNKKSSKNKKFLYFKTPQQYRLAFIHSVYRPYIIQYGRAYKRYSENTLISIPYYIDHLFKFHDFAFSLSQLELIPELLSSNKTPSMEHDLKNVIRYLRNWHLHETTVEMFDYKFDTIFAGEINYISKIYEEEAAAFNFTYDESFSAKSILIDKIKEHRSTHSKFNLDPNQINPQIYSISSLNVLLGDIHFFDQEYYDAVNCYSDANRAINNLKVDKINFRDFISLIKNKLKIGLCYEKTESFNEAMSFYSDATQDIKRLFTFLFENGKFVKDFSGNGRRDRAAKKSYPYKIPHNNNATSISVTTDANETKFENTFYTSALSDLLQICIQPFLAILYIQEKRSLEGITSHKSRFEMGSFFDIQNEVAKRVNQNHFIAANWMLHHGNLLYYKNSGNSSEKGGESTTDSLKFESPYLKNKLARLNFLFKGENSNSRQPTLALKCYILGLDTILRSRDGGNCFNKSSNNYLHFGIFDDILQNRNELYTQNHLNYIALFLSNIGNCILSLKYSDKSKYQIDIDTIMNVVVVDEHGLFIHKKIINRFDLKDAFRIFQLAAQFYIKAGKNNLAWSEYKKILHYLLMTVNPIDNPVVAELFLSNIKNYIVKTAKELANSAFEFVDSHMVSTMKKNVSSFNNTESLENSIAISQYYREIDIFYEKLKFNISLNIKNFEDGIKNLTEASQPYSSQYVRILQMELYSRFLFEKNMKIYKGNGLITDIENCKDDLVEYLFTRNMILYILKIYDNDKIMGPVYNAYIHYQIAEVLDARVLFDKKEIKLYTYLSNEKDGLREFILDALGGKSERIFDRDYHYNMARMYYKRALELHSAGKAYNDFIGQLIYLEDDFTDSNYHFVAAVERFLINKGKVAESLKKIDEILSNKKSSKMHLNKKSLTLKEQLQRQKMKNFELTNQNTTLRYKIYKQKPGNTDEGDPKKE